MATVKVDKSELTKFKKQKELEPFDFKLTLSSLQYPRGKNSNASTISSFGIRPCRKIQV